MQNHRSMNSGSQSSLASLLVPTDKTPLLTLVLDLDECLISCSHVVALGPVQAGGAGAFGRPLWSSAAPQGGAKEKHFVLRPHLFTLFSYLEHMLARGTIEVVFWTNGSKSHSGRFIHKLSGLWKTLRQQQGGHHIEDEMSSQLPPQFGRPWTVVVSPPKDCSGTKPSTSVVSSTSVSSPAPRTSSVGTSGSAPALNSGTPKPATTMKPTRPTGLFANVIFSDDSGKFGEKALGRLRRPNPCILVDNLASNINPIEKASGLVVADFEWNSKSPSTIDQMIQELHQEVEGAVKGETEDSTTAVVMSSKVKSTTGGLENDTVLLRLVSVLQQVVERMKAEKGECGRASWLEDCEHVQRTPSGNFALGRM